MALINLIMRKNIIIIVLVIIALIEGVVILSNKNTTPQSTSLQSFKKNSLPPAGPNAKGIKRPIILGKGMNLKSTPLFKYAYQIAPGDLTNSANKALIGWSINSQKQNDNSILITLTPKDSEDQNLQYTIKSNETLYFIEQTLADDKGDSDKDLNYRDDYGIIVDQNGIVQ